MASFIQAPTLETSFSDYCGSLGTLLERCLVTDQYEQRLDFPEAEALTLDMLLGIKGNQGKILLVGNGGSAAIMAHMQNDLCKADGIRAMVFHEPSLLTALSNDDGYEQAFERQIDLWADPKDLLIAVSSSGQSENLIRAATAAQNRGIPAITFTGFNPSNTLRQIGDVNYYVPCHQYGLVELSHSILCHYFTDKLMHHE